MHQNLHLDCLKYLHENGCPLDEENEESDEEVEDKD